MGASFETPGSPEIVELPRLIDDLTEGYTLLPRWHQRWSWSDEQRLDLLRSVRDGLPIGAPLVWRTRRTLPTHRHLVGRALGRAPEGALVQYVLDGVHRLATLWAAFAPEQERKAGLAMKPLFAIPPIGSSSGGGLMDGLPSRVYLDLEGGDFTLEPPGAPWFMPLGLTFDGRRMRRFQRMLERTSVGARRVEDMLRLSDDFSTAVSRCRLPLLVLAVDDPVRIEDAIRRLGNAGRSREPGEIAATLRAANGSRQA